MYKTGYDKFSLIAELNKPENQVQARKINLKECSFWFNTYQGAFCPFNTEPERAGDEAAILRGRWIEPLSSEEDEMFLEDKGEYYKLPDIVISTQLYRMLGTLSSSLTPFMTAMLFMENCYTGEEEKYIWMTYKKDPDGEGYTVCGLYDNEPAKQLDLSAIRQVSDDVVKWSINDSYLTIHLSEGDTPIWWLQNIITLKLSMVGRIGNTIYKGYYNKMNEEFYSYSSEHIKKSENLLDALERVRADVTAGFEIDEPAAKKLVDEYSSDDMVIDAISTKTFNTEAVYLQDPGAKPRRTIGAFLHHKIA